MIKLKTITSTHKEIESACCDDLLSLKNLLFFINTNKECVEIIVPRGLGVLKSIYLPISYCPFCGSKLEWESLTNA